uniref:F-box domain-containing protein n=1 Tax=Vannella robusta TaxID=1487602 RepID=A0A7S4HQQ4_9EUKA|mmetsp:Transcript_14193/g.17967  ORF Transcript_14193/g.17967 Transcript_14193/m.17967 type:complete len:296 (+) Transcript_14193:667-1554(+)
MIFPSLPLECSVLILSRLDFKSLMRIRDVCREARALLATDNELVWKAHVMARVLPLSTSPYIHRLRKAYLNCYPYYLLNSLEGSDPTAPVDITHNGVPHQASNIKELYYNCLENVDLDKVLAPLLESMEATEANNVSWYSTAARLALMHEVSNGFLIVCKQCESPLTPICWPAFEYGVTICNFDTTNELADLERLEVIPCSEETSLFHVGDEGKLSIAPSMCLDEYVSCDFEGIGCCGDSNSNCACNSCNEVIGDHTDDCCGPVEVSVFQDRIKVISADPAENYWEKRFYTELRK